MNYPGSNETYVPTFEPARPREARQGPAVKFSVHQELAALYDKLVRVTRMYDDKGLIVHTAICFDLDATDLELAQSGARRAEEKLEYESSSWSYSRSARNFPVNRYVAVAPSPPPAARPYDSLAACATAVQRARDHALVRVGETPPAPVLAGEGGDVPHVRYPE